MIFYKKRRLRPHFALGVASGCRCDKINATAARAMPSTLSAETLREFFPEDRPLYVDTFIILSLANYILARFVLNCTSLRGKTTRKGTSQTIYISYQYISLFSTTYCSYLGWYGWLYDRGTVDQDHLYGKSETAQRLGHVMTGYQFWNLLLCAFIKEYRTGAFLGHHITTAILSYSIPRPFVNYYALFFIGIAETSNFPLSLMDIMKGLELEPVYPKLAGVVRYTFALSFYVLRVFIWPYASYLFWIDALEKYDSIHSKPILILFLLGNTGLSLLQFYWGYLIGRRALGLTKPKPRSQKKKGQ